MSNVFSYFFAVILFFVPGRDLPELPRLKSLATSFY